jgi:hypothetical protein
MHSMIGLAASSARNRKPQGSEKSGSQEVSRGVEDLDFAFDVCPCPTAATSRPNH